MRSGTRRRAPWDWSFGLVGGLVVLGMVALGVSGCGDEETGSPSVRSMVMAQSSAPADSTARNRAPIVEQIMIRPERPAPGRSVRASARVSDPDGNSTSVIFRWRTDRGRVLAEGQTFDTTGLAPGSRLEVIAIVTDGVAEVESDVHSFRLLQPPLAIRMVAIDTSEGSQPGSILRAIVELENDASGRFEPSLSWKVNGAVVGSDPELETQRFSPGDIVILRAQLDLANRRTKPMSSRPLVLSRGGAPEFLSKPVAGIEGGSFRYQIRARSVEPGVKLTFELLRGPEGMRVGEQSGLVEWRPTSGQRGKFEIEVSATDQWGTGIAQSFSIIADSPTSPPASVR